jgi:uncharacterized membrane protein YedE/YeeE
MRRYRHRMAMTQRARAITALGLGAALLALVVPNWWEFFTTDSDHPDGHTLRGFYLPITAIFGVPGVLLLVLGVLVLRKEQQRRDG